jgi:hypothetical protein
MLVICSFSGFANYSYFCVARQSKLGPGRPIVEVFKPHTQLDTHTTGRTPLNEWSARRRGRYLHDTQQTMWTNIRALSGIRTRDPSNPARPHGHQDRQLLILSSCKCLYHATAFSVHYLVTPLCRLPCVTQLPVVIGYRQLVGQSVFDPRSMTNPLLN